MASSTFTSTNSMSAVVMTTVDNQTVNTPITVNAPSFSIDDVTMNEGTGAGTTAFNFTVTRTGGSALSSSVDVATQDQTATAPSDYTAIPTTTLTFPPSVGNATMTVTVLVNKDATYEPTETFLVNLSNAVNATISDASGTGHDHERR